MGLSLASLLTIIIFAGDFFPTDGFVRLNTPKPQASSDPSKVVLENATFRVFSETHLKEFDDLGFLKISHSEIGKIEEFSFDRFKHLNLLEISDNKIKEEIHFQTFSRLPGLEILVLRNLGLRHLELNLTNVQELIVAQNEIEELKTDRFIGKNINYFDISRNNLQKLDSSLGSLVKMSTIDISKNKINHIERHVFDQNLNLKTILASENQLTSTEGLNLPWLKTLDLFSNQITTLESNSFSKMGSLEELVLAFNRIKRIDDPFKDLVELKYLNLAWNHLEEIQPEVFRNNLYLVNLSLEGNKLKSLEKFVGDHHHLTHLDLSHNELSLLDDEFFFSMPNLEVLDLSFNRLKTLTDVLGPLSNLKVLNLAYNEISMTSYEFTRNHQLTRLNLTANNLQTGLSLFANNRELNVLDLSDNSISHFCDAEYPMKKLIKVNVRGNQIKDLSCLKAKNFPLLCEVDIRNNPLTCGQELNNLVKELTAKRSSPYRLTFDDRSDLSQIQCEILSLKDSLSLWNSVKRDICPKEIDIKLEEVSVKNPQKSEEVSSQEITEAKDIEKVESNVGMTVEVKNPESNRILVVPLGVMKKKDFVEVVDRHTPQSERLSWEEIDKNPELIDDLEEESTTKTRYSWYTIALLLIGLSLLLTCFNIAVFMYIRVKIWKKSGKGCTRRYTFLRNEVYKNTTEPSPTAVSVEDNFIVENQLRNKVFSFGKINEFFLNFGVDKKEKDTESTKNILVN